MFQLMVELDLIFNTVRVFIRLYGQFWFGSMGFWFSSHKSIGNQLIPPKNCIWFSFLVIPINSLKHQMIRFIQDKSSNLEHVG